VTVAQRTQRLVAIVAAFAAVAALYAAAAPAHSEWSHVGALLLAVPAAAAAFWFGSAGGLVAGTAGALLCFALHPPVAASSLPAVALEALFYPASGLAAGLLASRERRRAMASQAAVRQLTSAQTELRNSFEAMKRAERLFSLGQLSAGLAHEIRNPLGSIAGAVRILRRSIDSGPKQIECLDIIEQESQRLNRLLTNFLDFAKPRAPHFRPVDISAVFDTVMTLAAHGLSRDTVNLRKEVEPALPLPEADSEQLQQVLLNLTMNAIQATAESGEVVLSASRAADRHVLIRVRDQGVGVSPENIDRLFDPFFTTRENGTGLGLPVAHEIVRQFGGTLSADRNQDRGMTFSLLLPVHQKDLNETEADPAR
jgi:signal transduction histidine kinase